MQVCAVVGDISPQGIPTTTEVVRAGSMNIFGRIDLVNIISFQFEVLTYKFMTFSSLVMVWDKMGTDETFTYPVRPHHINEATLAMTAPDSWCVKDLCNHYTQLPSTSQDLQGYVRITDSPTRLDGHKIPSSTFSPILSSTFNLPKLFRDDPMADTLNQDVQSAISHDLGWSLKRTEDPTLHALPSQACDKCTKMKRGCQKVVIEDKCTCLRCHRLKASCTYFLPKRQGNRTDRISAASATINIRAQSDSPHMSTTYKSGGISDSPALSRGLSLGDTSRTSLLQFPKYPEAVIGDSDEHNATML
ncbi:hypothetical protein TREMEDRAFT_61452 [Tremella mesenterica DSM 1558]|uniref:uncharacterized protein n=1 Tax=Tremella mesenterica (strain ATCC 24925 / CBS 8224 / DSM 1558 / NBRC 9311 / NRRL Y-6157 / RJB 2259-6 / UBC 559-6) TaxID=578456 RepID=UPI0003F49487|nr:uncharacterized protein TREMEDRAFT_61452 [Tremella mesenterica DSM 1558]EIW70938.1 hypothetical protein TREMEDRAFT_61452 [Tremella mesenterica DSM 1558]